MKTEHAIKNLWSKVNNQRTKKIIRGNVVKINYSEQTSDRVLYETDKEEKKEMFIFAETKSLIKTIRQNLAYQEFRFGLFVIKNDQKGFEITKKI